MRFQIDDFPAVQLLRLLGSSSENGICTALLVHFRFLTTSLSRPTELLSKNNACILVFGQDTQILCSMTTGMDHKLKYAGGLANTQDSEEDG